MRMLVVIVVHVGMRVLHLLVLMLVLVVLGQMKPHTNTHKQTGDHQLHGDRLGQDHDGRKSANKRGRRKVCTGSRRTKMAKRTYEEGEADAIAKEPHQA